MKLKVVSCRFRQSGETHVGVYADTFWIPEGRRDDDPTVSLGVEGDETAVERPVQVWRQGQAVPGVKPLRVVRVAPWLDVRGEQELRVGISRDGTSVAPQREKIVAVVSLPDSCGDQRKTLRFEQTRGYERRGSFFHNSSDYPRIAITSSRTFLVSLPGCSTCADRLRFTARNALKMAFSPAKQFDLGTEMKQGFPQQS